MCDIYYDDDLVLSGWDFIMERGVTGARLLNDIYYNVFQLSAEGNAVIYFDDPPP